MPAFPAAEPPPGAAGDPVACRIGTAMAAGVRAFTLRVGLSRSKRLPSVTLQERRKARSK